MLPFQVLTFLLTTENDSHIELLLYTNYSIIDFIDPLINIRKIKFLAWQFCVISRYHINVHAIIKEKIKSYFLRGSEMAEAENAQQR